LAKQKLKVENKTGKKEETSAIAFWTEERKWMLVPFVLSILVYLAALSNDFVEWDDNRYVYDNPDLGKWNWEGWKYLLGKYVMGNWHPLTMISLSLDKLLFNLNPAGFHATNILFHGINSALLYLLCVRLTKNSVIALIASSLFAVHPMHVESVAWISERKDVLYTCGTLASLIYWHQWVITQKQQFWIISLVLFFLACTAKAQAVIMPVAALLITAWEKPDTLKEIKSFISIGPFFILSLIIGIVAIDAQTEGGNVRIFREYTWLDQILIALYGLFLYLAKTIAPIAQSAYYPYPIKENGSLPILYFVVPIILVLLSGTIFYFSKKHKIIWFGMGFFLIAILPVLQIMPVGETMISERYYYLPSAGLFMVVAWLIAQIPLPGKVHTLLASVLLLALGYLCHQRVKIWNNTYSLFLDVMHQHENVPVAYNNIANQFTKDKKYDIAIPLYKKALSIRPKYAIGWHNLGNNYTHLGNYPQALKSFKQYLSIRPDDEVVFKKIGTVYSKMGSESAAANNLTDAEKYLILALEHDPDLTECYVNLGNIAAMKQDFGTAENRYNSALMLNPENSGTWFNLGMMRLQSGKNQEGVEAIRKAANLGNTQAAQWLSQTGNS
jgi:Tfp pilus assembly protein PilF